MGKNNGTTKYGGVVQLLVIAGALVTPLLVLAFNLMDLELFSVSKTTFNALFSSIKPWLCPPYPYVYLLINFIIFFIAASSSNPIVFNPPIISTDEDHHQWQSLTDEDDSFLQSSLACPVEFESSLEGHVNFHTSSSEGSGFKDPRMHDDESVVDKVKRRELRKSKTFHEGVSKHRGRRERYVRILSQQELDRQVEAFIYRCKQDTNLHR